MENYWNTTPLEDALFILFLLCCFIALALFLFALAMTYAAVTGRFSSSAIVLYWCHLYLSVLLWICGFELTAVLLPTYGAPLVALAMHLLARRDKSKVTMTSTWDKTTEAINKQKGGAEHL
jgi:hypothetical protein